MKIETEPISSKIPYAHFLKYSEAFRDNYFEAISKCNDLAAFNLEIIRGRPEYLPSNIFSLAAISNLAWIDGRLANISDLQKILGSAEGEFLQNEEYFVPCGLAVIDKRPASRKNIKFASWLEESGISLENGGVLIDPNDLVLWNCSSPYGLDFSLKEGFKKDSVRKLTDFDFHSIADRGIAVAGLFKGKFYADCHELSAAAGSRVIVIKDEMNTKQGK